MPHDTTDDNIVTLFNKKGDQSSNYRAWNLFCKYIVSKVFAEKAAAQQHMKTLYTLMTILSNQRPRTDTAVIDKNEKLKMKLVD